MYYRTENEAMLSIDGFTYYTLLEHPPESSPPNNRCVLLVHALMSNLNMWDATVKALHEAGYSTLRFDHIGHARSPLPPSDQGSVHMDEITRHMREIVKATGCQEPIRAVIGCSIGGVLALRYAMLFPGAVARVVSICAPGAKAPEAAHALWSQRIEQFRDDVQHGTDKLHHATVDRWFAGDCADESARAECLRHVKTCSLQGYELLANTIRDYDYVDQLPRLRGKPCLVVAGSADTASSTDVLQGIAQEVGEREAVVMEGAGHLPPMQQKEGFNDLMLGFLKEDIR